MTTISSKSPIISPISIRLDDRLRARLETAAKSEERSLSYLAQQAITEYLDDREYKIQELLHAYKEAEKGVFISEKTMTAWVDSWGSTQELPPPKPDIATKL